MTQPQPDSPQQPVVDTARMQRRLESLDKCEGWKDWLLPHLEQKLKQAEESILQAVMAGLPVNHSDAATVTEVKPFLDMIETQRRRILTPP